MLYSCGILNGELCFAVANRANGASVNNALPVIIHVEQYEETDHHYDDQDGAHILMADKPRDIDPEWEEFSGKIGLPGYVTTRGV